MNRYFVDERVGCIAVRDRLKTDPEYQGLHPDTEGVVRFWGLRPVPISNTTFVMGSNVTITHWRDQLDPADIKSAHNHCDDLNEREFYSLGGCD